ncbi:hypothetical protein ACWDGI_12830 [Streptomyces sp. NPDC001220]
MSMYGSAVWTRPATTAPRTTDGGALDRPTPTPTTAELGFKLP